MSYSTLNGKEINSSHDRVINGKPEQYKRIEVNNIKLPWRTPRKKFIVYTI